MTDIQPLTDEERAVYEWQIWTPDFGEAGRRDLIFDSGKNLQPSILLFVGDDQIQWHIPVTLQDRDVVTILSPISGG